MHCRFTLSQAVGGGAHEATRTTGCRVEKGEIVVAGLLDPPCVPGIMLKKGKTATSDQERWGTLKAGAKPARNTPVRRPWRSDMLGLGHLVSHRSSPGAAGRWKCCAISELPVVGLLREHSLQLANKEQSYLASS